MPKTQKKQEFNRNFDRTLPIVAKPNSFRFKSTRILSAGYSSGYHEAAVTTDSYEILQSATDNHDGTHTLNVTNKSSFFKTGTRVQSATLKSVLEIAGGYRTDTARTILSGRNNTAVQHSGSMAIGVKAETAGQVDAHDILRESVLKVLQMDPKTKGLSKKSIAVLFGSYAISSMAPGELARTVPRSDSLKDQAAKGSWENDRNRAKSRLDAAHLKLHPDEQRFVEKHVEGFVKTLSPNSLRYLAKKPNSSSTMPHTPRRSQLKQWGGGYENKELEPEDLSPPDDAEALGRYFTQPFRKTRRILKTPKPPKFFKP